MGRIVLLGEAPAVLLERTSEVAAERKLQRLFTSQGPDAFREMRDINRPLLDRALNAEERKWFYRYYGVKGPIRGATSYAGVEPLAWLKQGSPAAIANNATVQSFIQFSTVTGEVGPFSPAYWKEIGDQLRLTAVGVASCTVTPTLTFTWTQGTTWANPITGTLAISPAIAFGSGLTNCFWYVDGASRVILTGQSGAVISICKSLDNFAATATWVPRVWSNATPPSNVTENFTLSQYLDFCGTWSAANAANTAQMLEYALESVR